MNILLLTTLLAFTPEVIDVSEEVNEGITKQTLTVSFGLDPIEEFTLHNLYKEECPYYIDVIWPMPVGFGIEYHETLGDPEAPYTSNFLGSAASFCLNMIVVDEPGEVPLGGCESGAYDCSIPADWGLSFRAEEMIDFARGELKNPNKKPIIAGYVAGAITAGAAVNANPDWFSGLGLIGGTPFAAPGSGIKEYNEFGCNNLLPPNGGYDPGMYLFKLLLTKAKTNPNDLVVAPEAFLLPAVPQLAVLVDPTYREVFDVLMLQHIDNANWPGPEYTYCTDDGAGGMLYCDEDEMLALGDTLRYYADLWMIGDMACSLGDGYSSPYIANIGEFEGRILATVDAKAFGPAMSGYLEQFTSAKSIKTLESDRAESDRMHSPSRIFTLDAPFILWAWWTYLTQ